MSCQSFEAAINDLARDQMMEADARRRALAHSAACERCGARLADERALSAGLRKMAESREEAPASVEASLREAFGAWVAAQREPVIVAANPVWPRRFRWAGAAAAILLVCLLALMAVRSRPAEMEDKKEQASHKPQPQSETPRPADPRPEPPPRELTDIGTGKRRTAVRNVVSRSHPRNASRLQANPAGADDRETEIATEFIPLIHDGDVALPDGGHIMRVELPRSALISFGLPMNVERAGQRVRADVVVGNDGLARAIRFVR